MRSRILVVGRDIAQRTRLARMLNGAGYRTELAESVAHAQRIGCKGIALAIVVHDGPGCEGDHLVDELRGTVARTLLVSTNPGAHAGSVDAMDLAGEDGLLARVAEALQPPVEADVAETVLQFAGYRLDLAGHSLTDEAGREIALTRGEFGLLQAFVQRPCRVLSRDFLMQVLAGRDAEAFDRSIDMLVARLRRKIEPDPKHPSLILTVPGSGYKFTAKVQTANANALPPPDAAAMPSADAPATFRSWRPNRIVAAGVAGFAAVCIAIMLAVLTWPHHAQPLTVAPVGAAQDASLPLPEKPSIAVLPFVTIGGDARQERLADGIAEDVITDLSRYREFFVIGRYSAFTYKGKAVSAQQVGRELGVRYVLNGSIQTVGERVRVTAQLIEAASNVQVWSEGYNRALGDILDVQGEVTQNISATLGGSTGIIMMTDTAISRRKLPLNLEAYDLVLLGYDLMVRRTEKDHYKAEELFKKAIELDPQFARAYGYLAVLYDIRFNQRWGKDNPSDLLDKARDNMLKAIALDPTDGIYYARLSQVYFEQSDFDHGMAAVERSLQLNPNDPNILMYCGELLPFVGRAREGVDLLNRAFRLNPRHPDWYNYQADPFYVTGQYEVAIALLMRAERDRPIWSSITLALSYAQLGRQAETTAAVATLLRRYPNFSMERALSEFGGIKDPAMLAHYLDGVRKAGLRECAGADERQAHPKMVRLPVCDARRAAAPSVTSDSR